MNEYLADILSQPAALRLALQKIDLSPLESVSRALALRHIDRIVMTGMGASYYGLYPAWLQLAAAGLPAIWVDTAELAHHAPALVGEGTLLWVASQSGRSAEVVRLLEKTANRSPAGLIAITNDPESPLGRAAHAWSSGRLLLLHVEPETSVSTRTYLNTLAISQMVSRALIASDPASAVPSIQAVLTAELLRTADEIESYLENRWVVLDQIETFLNALPHPSPQTQPVISLLGRGSSMAAVYCGALYLEEAAKTPALPFQAGEFRHGPLEFASPHAGFWVFVGEKGGEAHRLNWKIYHQLREIGAQARALDLSHGFGGPPDGEEYIAMPAVSGIGLPLAEILPLQLLSYRLAERGGFTPGALRFIGKVTAEE